MKNGREIVEWDDRKTGGTRKGMIKSQGARDYVQGFLLQVHRPPKPYMGPVALEADIYYRNPKCDLDESLLMDCLQLGTQKNPGAGIIGNDNQIKDKWVRWHLDKSRPRVVVKLIQFDKVESIFQGF